MNLYYAYLRRHTERDKLSGVAVVARNEQEARDKIIGFHSPDEWSLDSVDLVRKDVSTSVEREHGRRTGSS